MGKLTNRLSIQNVDDLILGQHYKYKAAVGSLYYIGKCYAYMPKIKTRDDYIITLEYTDTPEVFYCFSYGSLFNLYEKETNSFICNYIFLRENKMNGLTLGTSKVMIPDDKIKIMMDDFINQQKGWQYTKTASKESTIITKVSETEVKIELFLELMLYEENNIRDIFRLDYLNDRDLWDFSSFIYFFESENEANDNLSLFMDADSVVHMLSN